MPNILVVNCSTGQTSVRAQTAAELAAVATWATNPVTPDPSGFVQAVKVAAGGIVAASALPNSALFFSACMMGEWADVQALLVASQSVLPIALYSAIKTLAATYNIPITI